MENRLGGWMKRTPVALRIGLVILVFAPGLILGITWSVKNTGVHAWLVDFQARLIDAYYPTATFLLTITVASLVTAGPMLLVLFLVNCVIPAPPSEAPPAPKENGDKPRPEL